MTHCPAESQPLTYMYVLRDSSVWSDTTEMRATGAWFDAVDNYRRVEATAIIGILQDFCRPDWDQWNESTCTMNNANKQINRTRYKLQ